MIRACEPARANAGSGAAKRWNGFTLLEVLVVLLIVGIVASFAVLAVGNRSLDDRLTLEARRLNQLIHLASDTAVIQSTQVGLIVNAHDYRFVALRDGKWVPFPAPGPLRPRKLPEPLTAVLHTDGLNMPEASRKALGGEDNPPPQVLILSSGEMTPFRLEVDAAGADAYYRIDADLLGHVKMTRVVPDNA